MAGVLKCCSDVGVPAGGGAAAPSDSPPPGGPAEDRRAAAPLQSRPGEEALFGNEESCLRHPGEIFLGGKRVKEQDPEISYMDFKQYFRL